MLRIVVAVLIIFSSFGCCPISKSTFEMHKSAVKAAVESSEDALANWSDYNPEQQRRWLEANRNAWQRMNEVYNRQKP
jgi:hypothetical protein